MQIGVVSDTHNHLANVRRIVELMNAAGVERVVHTGDITRASTLELFARLEAPLVGVYGNNDERETLGATARELGMHLCEPPLALEWAGRRIVVVHDPRDLRGVRGARHELALHGHTHRRELEREDGWLRFNPGECAGHLLGHNAVGMVDLATLRAEVLRF